ncbi:T9SS type B sorting domain-containing protein [Aquirufa ecclesiirivi]|uniref:T9SS type B sorting domain-containing protein n=1 Tax=Aquirufa ecclesiirivi TaxID=2715124 RepID=UPI0022A874C0|nr:gliding motility-associated C-terminal domain-containing protein [Aquirufa ecclesiirivi]MCZ2472767.1 T9SS type B sorting domain-containing protein [Aquirufa ecclesiirivi]
MCSNHPTHQKAIGFLGHSPKTSFSFFFCVCIPLIFLSLGAKAERIHDNGSHALIPPKEWKQKAESPRNNLNTGLSAKYVSTATHLKITGEAQQIAGTSQDITITALDDDGNVDVSYTGTKNLFFSGASTVFELDSSELIRPGGKVIVLADLKPTVNEEIFESTQFSVFFANGMATLSLTLYKAENATITVTDTNSGIVSLGSDQLQVNVSPDNFNNFRLYINQEQFNRIPFLGRNLVKAVDRYYNTIVDFDASLEPVFIRLSNLPGIFVRASGSNLLNLKSDFVQGIADLTAIGMVYSGIVNVSGNLIVGLHNKQNINNNIPMYYRGGDGASLKVLSTSGNSNLIRNAGRDFDMIIRAFDLDGNIANYYQGNKSITFSASASPANTGQIPQINERNIGEVNTFFFDNGQTPTSGIPSIFYKVEEFYISATDGTISSSSISDQLLVKINPNPTLGRFKAQLYSPQTSGESFIGENTLTALDIYDNVITNYNAGTSVNNVRVTTSLNGTITGLSGVNVLNRAGDFVGGVANLTRLGLKFTGREGVGTFTFTRNQNNVSGTSNAITMYSGDRDQDGLLDTYEVGNNAELPHDTDKDGLVDFVDKDSDNDSLLDVLEGGGDTDHDGIPNFLDLDSDGDWLGDSDERDGDNDLDGKPNYVDDDSDNDGISDAWEGKNKCTTCLSKQDDQGDGWDDRGQFVAILDTDKDGQPDFLDQDSDNDQIPDRVELGADIDGDATPNFRDLDSDNDGIPDTLEAGNFEHPRDTDLDGLADFEDVDSDNDGLSDRVEVGPNPNSPLDTDQDGIPNYLDLDADGDGISDVIELGKNPFQPVDTDADGQPDFLDQDADGDGIPDAIEKGANSIPQDSDQDGTADFQDTDSDGDSISDKLEAGANPLIPVDTDTDGIADILDLDSDNDAITDQIEVGENPLLPLDTDLDGIANYRDVDSDADSIPDQIEVGQNNAIPLDTDSDGKADYLDADADNDGIPDQIEVIYKGDKPVDTDADGKADYIDLDSDGDGIADLLEAGPNPLKPLDTDQDGLPNFQDMDSDADSISDTQEAGLNPEIPADFDADGIPNYMDVDSDNDTIFDKVEAKPALAGPADTDQDGFADYLDLDSDNDKILDRLEVGKDVNNPMDSDQDGIADFRDVDADGDKIPDAIEVGKNPLSPIDSDGDGKPDYLDIDSDNNGIIDTDEVGPDPTNPLDTDADGIYNYLDADDDGDGLIDKLEDDVNFGALPDCDRDGIPNSLDADVCDTYLTNGFSPNGDGVNDYFVIPGIKSLPDHHLSIFNRWGNLVYETDNYQNNWDGQSTNLDIPMLVDGKIVDGIYFYLIDFKGLRPTISSFLYVNRLKK